MLVRTFKTAAEIGLPQHEYEVLIQLLGMMERGEVTEGLFDMERIGNPRCGTPGCIIGWAYALGAHDFHTEIGTDQQWRAFRRLTEARTATLGQATRALHNYLTTGYPHWRDVLAA